MDENQTPQQNGLTPPEPNQTPDPNMNQPRAQSQVPTPEQPEPKKSRKIPLIIVLLVLLLVGGGTAAYFMSLDEEPTPAETFESTDATTPEDLVGSEAEEPAVEDEALVIENEYFTLKVPEGFSVVGERIFTFTGAPANTYSFKNETTNDYFEVNVTPAASGLNADFVWTYVFSDGIFTVDKTNSTVCLPEESEWCEFSGANGRLDSAIFSEPETPINDQVYYFTFGNTSSETVGDLSYVDQFLENISF